MVIGNIILILSFLYMLPNGDARDERIKNNLDINIMSPLWDMKDVSLNFYNEFLAKIYEEKNPNSSKRNNGCKNEHFGSL